MSDGWRDKSEFARLVGLYNDSISQALWGERAQKILKPTWKATDELRILETEHRFCVDPTGNRITKTLQQRWECSDGSHEWRDVPVQKVRTFDPVQFEPSPTPYVDALRDRVDRMRTRRISTMIPKPVNATEIDKDHGDKG